VRTDLSRLGRAAGLALLLALPLALVAACGSGGSDPGGSDSGLEDRQAEVAERGAEVMPFDLDATTHRFEPTGTGLVQTVVADDPADGEQVALVREHLAAEADAFRRGDFGDPAAIHGEDMPGLAALEGAAGEVDVALDDLPDGARLTFTAGTPELVDALHLWAEAQVMDHGDHAEHT
jgi:hypothetical protein